MRATVLMLVTEMLVVNYCNNTGNNDQFMYTRII